MRRGRRLQQRRQQGANAGYQCEARGKGEAQARGTDDAVYAGPIDASDDIIGISAAGGDRYGIAYIQ